MVETPSRLLKSAERGVIVKGAYERKIFREFSTPIEGIVVEPFDSQELRFWLLYWDKIAYPKPHEDNYSRMDAEDLLKREGYLVFPEVPYLESSSLIGDMMTSIQYESYKRLSIDNPSQWAMAQADRSYFLRHNHADQDGGIQIALYQAIPVPVEDAPIESILDFKLKRHSELMRLRVALDTMSRRVLEAENLQDELARCAVEIDSSCSDLIKASREKWYSFKLTDLHSVISGSAGKGIMADIADFIGPNISMPGIATLVGATKSGFKIFNDFQLRQQKIRENPFFYSVDFSKKFTS